MLVSPDDSIPPARRLQAVVSMSVTDELTGRPPDSLLSLEVKERRLLPRVASGGLVGLVGVPQEVFPGLQTQDYLLHLTIRGDRYVAREVEVRIPKDPAFPATFTAQQLTVALHREPVVIAGRTTRFISGVATTLGGATLILTGIWRTAPPAHVTVAADPPHLVSLQPPLYADRVALPHFLRHRDLLLAVGPVKTLLDDLLPGTNSIRLSDRQGLNPGEILLIDADQPDLAEFIAMRTVPVTSAADQPTLITLQLPVLYAHRRGAVVKEVVLQPPGPQRQFTVPGNAGDTCVFLDALTGLANTQEVEITGPPSPREYHKLHNFSVTTDVNGYYRLPPLSRVAQLEIHAEKTVGVQTFTTTATFRPDYRQRENRLDLTLTV
jgi:hypothetical protein